MPHYNVKPIHLVLQPSYVLAAILAAAGLGSCIIVVCMPMTISLKILICVPIGLATAFFIVLDGLLQLPQSFLGLDINTKGKLMVTDGQGKKIEANVLPSSFVTPYLTVLNLKIAGRMLPRSFILLAGRLDEDSFRQLRVWLR